jgi:hypothetical protein
MAELGGWFSESFRVLGGNVAAEKPGVATTDGATPNAPGASEAVNDQQAKLDALEVRSAANPSFCCAEVLARSAGRQARKLVPRHSRAHSAPDSGRASCSEPLACVSQTLLDFSGQDQGARVEVVWS